MIAKYKGTCQWCAEEIEPGDQIAYFGNGETYHWDCRPAVKPKPAIPATEDFADYRKDNDK